MSRSRSSSPRDGAERRVWQGPCSILRGAPVPPVRLASFRTAETKTKNHYASHCDDCVIAGWAKPTGVTPCAVGFTHPANGSRVPACGVISQCPMQGFIIHCPFPCETLHGRSRPGVLAEYSELSELSARHLWPPPAPSASSLHLRVKAGSGDRFSFRLAQSRRPIWRRTILRATSGPQGRSSLSLLGRRSGLRVQHCLRGP